MSKGRVSLDTIIKEFNLDVLYLPSDASEIFLTKPKVNRPAFPLSGFYDCFDPERIQLLGTSEHVFLSERPKEEQRERLKGLMNLKPPAIIYTHGNQIDEMAIEVAKECGIPLLASNTTTTEFMSALIAFLNVRLAPTITRHGVLVEVYGEGILIMGDSGVGKSETAIELIKRGHRFIADDAVVLKKVSAISIVGSAPELIRHYIELRGIGIVDVCRLFGMGAVKETEKVNLVVHFEPWENGKMYERLGMDDDYTEIMGIKIPSLTVPVKPGRNLAVILEIAAMNNRQKRMGYNTAKEFNEKLMKQMESGEELF